MSPLDQPEFSPELDEIGELEIAEYVVFLLALDTYIRYVGEFKGLGATDDLIKKAVVLVRMADNVSGDAIKSFFLDHLEKPAQKNQLIRAFSFTINQSGLANRALRMRSLLKRGGPALVSALFKASRARQEVKKAMTAALMDDADQALKVLAALPMKNVRIRKWIDEASELAGSAQFQNPVAAVASEVVEASPAILDANLTQDAKPGTEEAKQAVAKHEATLAAVQTAATVTAAKALKAAGIEDKPATTSEVHGIVAATVAAVMSNPDVPKNLPESFINSGRPLDSEQAAAALTDGRVLVAAGAGAGKSTTLVSRVAYLINERQQDSGKILVCCFNKKAATQLAGKVTRKVGTNNVRCGTMHSVFKSFVVGNKTSAGLGNADEKAMLEFPRLISDEGKLNGTTMSVAIRNMWLQCEDAIKQRYSWMQEEWFEDGPPKAKQANLYMNTWRGNGVTLEQAKDEVTSQAEGLAYIWYEMYLGLKGDIPGWRPPCDSKAYSKFMGTHRKGGERLGDMEDMQKTLLDILRRDPKARDRLQNAFHHILVDEAQDLNLVQHEIFDIISKKITPGDGKSIWMIGDDKQCPSSDTQIATSNGPVKAGDLKTGDKVLAWRNGQIQPQAAIVSESDWTWGYRITTESGRALTVSPNHKIWAGPPVLESDQVAVYLMFRADMGFRVGITNKGQREAPYLQSIAGRAFQEKAEKMWFLSIHATREAAKLEESRVSLAYGIPTLVFNGVHRGLNQERIEATFKEFGRNGLRCLEDRHLSLDYPHWISKGYAKHGRERRVVQLLAHGHRGSLVRLEWSADENGVNPMTSCLGDIPFETTSRGRYRIRKTCVSYRDARDFAVQLARATGALLNHTLWTPDGALQKITAAGIFPGMLVPVEDHESLILEEVASVERVETTFVNLEVDDASSFFGGGILSSNCIYQFRGSRPELFAAFAKKEGWAVRYIRTNYRCAPEIVEAANRLQTHNKDNIEMECRAEPKKDRGSASIVVDTPADSVSGAIDTIGNIVQEHKHGEGLEKFAVLARTNKELNEFETACIVNEVSYVRKGGKGFLDAPESKALLGYIDLVTGDSYESMKQSLVAALLYPDRGIFMGFEDAEKCVNEALADVARMNRVDKSMVNPAVLLEGRNAGILADALKRPYKTKLVNSGGERFYGRLVDELADNLQGLASDLRAIDRSIKDNPGQPTSELLNTILDGVSSTVNVYDAKERRSTPETKTLREHVSLNNAIFADEDDDDEQGDQRTDEEKAEAVSVNEDGTLVDKDVPEVPKAEGAGLGSIQFLFQMARPNENDAAHATDPSEAKGFIAKVARYRGLADKLRIDPKKWEAEHGDEPPPAVTLSTVHKVKGAEWEHVTVMMPKGKFPMEMKLKKGDPPPDPEKEKKRLEAERNLAYVALTRAAKNLKIICPARVQGQRAGISPFVLEAGLAPGENVIKPDSVATTSDSSEEVVKVAFGQEEPDYLELAAHAQYLAFSDENGSYDRRGQ